MKDGLSFTEVRILESFSSANMCGKLMLNTVGISRVPLKTARNFVNRTVLFPHDEEKNYVIELDVFHQLHCLVRIKSPQNYLMYT